MKKHFFTPVDLRSRKSMIEFLTGHFRYDTMNSWNRMTSYANKVKFNNLGLTRNQLDRAYDLLGADESFWDHLQPIIEQFTREQNYHYTIGSNGRSGGYLVLYSSHREETGHKSYCLSCGQRNFKSVAHLPADPMEAIIAQEVIKSGGVWMDQVYLSQSAIAALAMSEEEKLKFVRLFRGQYRDTTIGNRCGACGSEGDRGRVNFASPPMRLSVSAKGIDDSVDFDDADEWSMSDLRDRVRLVQSFDAACDRIREAFIDLLDNCEIEEEEVVVTKTRKVIRCVC